MENIKNPDKGTNYRTEEAGLYENQAAEIDWHGHEILFGLMYEFVKPGETLLDIGIGTGLGSFLFHKAGLQVSGFDKSAEMLEECGLKNFTVKIIQHDLLDMPFPYYTDSFNNIISLAVLNFFADPAPVFKEASRIIKSNGAFGFTVERKRPGQESQYIITVGDPDNTNDPFKVIMHRHSDEYIRSALISCGFAVKKSYEFLADRYPDQGIEVYLKIYVAQEKL